MARLGRARARRIINYVRLIQDAGTVTLAADSTLTTVGTRVAQGAIDLTADTSLTAGAIRTANPSVTLVADTTLAALGQSGTNALLPAVGTLTVGPVAMTVGAAGLNASATLSVIITLDTTIVLAADSSLSPSGLPTRMVSITLGSDANLFAGTQAIGLGAAVLAAQASLIAIATGPGYVKLEFFDMEATVTPPTGHQEPVPITLGANWQPNDIRLLFVSAEATGEGSITVPIPMKNDPPTGFTSLYSANIGAETRGIYYRRLAAGDPDSQIDFPKPPGWREFMFSVMTVRGVNPAIAPVAGKTVVTNTVGNSTCSVASVSIPAAGTMVLMLGSVPDPGGGWPSWAVSMGVPTGWTPLVATDKSGSTFYPYDTNPGLNLVGKSYSTSGSTGAVAFPVALGSPAFAGMYVFLRPSPDVSATIGAV